MPREHPERRGNKVVGYLRYAMPNLGTIARDKEALKNYANTKGYRLVEIVVEIVAAAAPSKPLFDRIVAAIGAGTYQGVITPTMSHLAIPMVAARAAVQEVKKARGWLEIVQVVPR